MYLRHMYAPVWLQGIFQLIPLILWTIYIILPLQLA